MREITFRGKRIDNGEWVEGNLLGKELILPHGQTLYKSPENHLVAIDVLMYTVDPATVGQYTGLNDKNGKRIFEGDIVDCIARMDRANCVVIFEEGEFRLVPGRNYKTYVTGGGYHALRCFEKEVIGNIHDNPELLEEEPT